MDNNYVSEVNAAHKSLLDASRIVKTLYYMEPINESQEKDKFFATFSNPKFEYRPLEYDPSELVDKIFGLDMPEDEIGNLLERKKRNLLFRNIMMLQRGDKEKMIESTSAMHGAPNQSLVEYADRIIRSNPPFLPVQTTFMSPQWMRDKLYSKLSEYGIEDWKIELSDKNLTTVYPAEKKISLSNSRLFSGSDLEKFVSHEINTHVLRCVNGYFQPLLLFAVGFPGYLSTEEGLASYMEEMNGGISSLREFAARVIAVDSLCSDLDFSEAFDRLRSYHFSDEQCWNLAVRAYRGGGCVKDHVYLQGNIEIKKFVAQGKDISQLFVGKIGISHIPLVDQLRSVGLVFDPKIIPNNKHP